MEIIKNGKILQKWYFMEMENFSKTTKYWKICKILENRGIYKKGNREPKNHGEVIEVLKITGELVDNILLFNLKIIID